MTRQIILFVLLVFISLNTAYSQKYDVAGGIRWGGDFGLTAVERVKDNITLEQNLIAENDISNYSLMLLGRYHRPLITSRFNWFVGGGLDFIRLKGDDERESKTTFGPVLQTGLELTIDRIVLDVSVEPVFYNDNSDFKFKMGKAFSVKYIFIKKKSKVNKKFSDIFKKKNKKKK
ncbi:MAG: hypothetical protein R2771_14700 [Saprospiraceae bacterium]